MNEFDVTLFCRCWHCRKCLDKIY